MKSIGLIDADLCDKGTRHPNLALMKISAHWKEKGANTKLLLDYDGIDNFDEVYISKVFSYTHIDKEKEIINKTNVRHGGTGFFFDRAPDLDINIEHHLPDYHLYDEYVNSEINRGIKRIRFRDYLDYSIGFATRGCFRKCDFCVNRKYKKVFRHARISEFFDPSRKYIYLWDDNLFAYERWHDVFNELGETGRRFQCRQGLDMRLITPEKAIILANSKYIGDYIFAFDFLKDRPVIERKLQIWRKYCSKTTKLYLLCGYESQDVNDIISIFERISVLMRFRCLPYIMRYERWAFSEFKGMYINIARWCNQPDFFKKKSFREYCEANGEFSSTMRYLRAFEKQYPEVARRYFDMKYELTPMDY